AARYLALVRSVRRSRHSRDSPVPGQGRVDAALHEQRDGQRLSAALPGAELHPIALTGVRAILLDIEGTTTPIAFVHQVLFPYARARLADFLGVERESKDVVEVLRRFAEERA